MQCLLHYHAGRVRLMTGRIEKGRKRILSAGGATILPHTV